MAFAQGVTVQGKVTDESGTPLPGVTVLLKGTSVAAPTGGDGTYTINVPDGNGTLVFSFIGFAPQEVAIDNRSTVDVQLGADAEALEEVVVVGYGTQKKETVTGSVAAVKGAELEKSPAVNLTNSIAGRMPGVVAVNRSGEPGYDGSSIRIRGSNTLGNNGALVVIDGIPARAGGIERLNPADIESISVLKDASAAIYGSRAANGVILVTTKRGTVGKPELSYSFNQGFAQPTVIPDLTDAVQFAEMRNDLEIYNRVPSSLWEEAKEAFRQSGSYTLPDGSVVNAHYGPDDFQKFRDGSNPWTHPNTDWYDATLKEWSPQSQHNLQLTGGSENIKFLTSLGYVNQDAFYKNSATGYKQYDLRVNLDANVSKYIKTSIGMLGRQENRFFPTVGAGAIFRMQMRGIPTAPARWPDGRPGPDIENGENPVVITTNETGYDRDTRSYLQTNGSVEITNPWVEGLKLTATAAVDKMTRRTKRWQIPWFLYDWDKQTYEADGVTPLLTAGRRGPADPNLNMSDEEELKILLGAVLSFERTFGDHGVTVLAGTNRETIEGDWFSAYRRYFISPAIDQLNVGGDLEKSNNGDAVERARLSHFGRFAYNYKEKYMAEFLWRYDASDIFPADTRYGFFPGVLAAWRISEENFFKDNISFINNLKLRGSWGQMGNDDIGELYSYLSLNQFNSYIIGGQEVKTLRETRVPNPFITWEVANNANIGLDGQMLQGKINFEFEVFYNKRTSILWQQSGTVPQTTGMTLPRQNIGEVANRGWDALVGYNNQFGDVSLSVSANGGYAKNEILYWAEAPGAPDHQRSTGMPMGTSLRYEYDGVFADQADIDANPIDYSAIVGTLRPGDMKYKDVSGPNGVPDGKITPDDRTRDPRNDIPTFQGGLNANVGYKNFDFSVLFQGSAGAVTTIGTGEMGSIGNFLEDIYVNRWTVDNHSSEHPRISDRGNQYYSGGNTYWMRSTNYIRLKNIELGYTLPVSIGEKIGLSALRVYVNALNLATWDKLKVYDPENVNANGQYYPQSRVINTGVTVTF
ncbi:SusC/RagA family TonB-linked outer membrane protein [Pontibacter russatus]|uniref:SusC/RagA family TonB-linked outer membrane protein n=1 Tax=Pontibacter russatus TaxID=2694929 RepID=UPI001F29561F|nr:TonB-dependent receptor [Pontibacter russatus]